MVAARNIRHARARAQPAPSLSPLSAIIYSGFAIIIARTRVRVYFYCLKLKK